jgi:hypothetical protein
MPPKRPLTDTNSYQSPPPAHRAAPGNEHHHSPLPGHHQETPVDAAVAITTPPRNNIRNDAENLSPTNGSCPSASTVTGEMNGMATTTAMQNPSQAEMQPVAVVGGGARAAYQASPPQAEIQPVAVVGGGARAAYQATQQQRIITCNLSNIPLSK